MLDLIHRAFLPATRRVLQLKTGGAARERDLERHQIRALPGGIL